MNFLFFLWNTFARVVSFLFLILVEIVIFTMLVNALNEAGMSSIANLLKVIFIIWIIIDIILKIFVGGGKALIRYIFKF